MHVAALNEHADLIVVLYALGATLEAEDRNERTPLHKAIAYRKFISVRRLLELNVNTTNVVTEDEHIRKLLNDHAKTPVRYWFRWRFFHLNIQKAASTRRNSIAIAESVSSVGRRSTVEIRAANARQHLHRNVVT